MARIALLSGTHVAKPIARLGAKPTGAALNAQVTPRHCL